MDTSLSTSAALFGNEKMAAVLVHLNQLDGLATAQHIAIRSAINHSLVSKVLRRLETAGVLVALPRSGSRAEQFFQVADRSVFDLLAVLAARVVSGAGWEETAEPRSTGG